MGHGAARPGSTNYLMTYFNSNFDIGSPMSFVVTTPATGSYVFGPDVNTHQTVNIAMTEGVTIGVAGTAILFRNLNRGITAPDRCEVLCEYGGTYTGGTKIYDVAFLRAEEEHHWILAASTSYLVKVTTKADDNYTSMCFHLWGDTP